MGLRFARALAIGLPFEMAPMIQLLTVRILAHPFDDTQVIKHATIVPARGWDVLPLIKNDLAADTDLQSASHRAIDGVAMIWATTSSAPFGEI